MLQDDHLNINHKSRLRESGWNLEKLVEKVCQYVGVEPAELLQRGRQNKISIAKSLVCCWGTQILGISSSEIAKYLGISQSAISMAAKRGAGYCEGLGIDWMDVITD